MTKMIAVDSSVFVDYLKGAQGKDMELMDELLAGRQVSMVPVVLSELLTSAHLTKEVEGFLKSVPTLPLREGYWVRAGELRRLLHSKGLKAYLPDTLVAQFCLDHELPLLTRDDDFKHFSKHGGLKLV
jgi:predicted nucleic acid-binding protein